MESYNPERFSTLVPHRYSGFLHRAGQLFTDADFGVKIQNIGSEEERSSVQTTGSVERKRQIAVPSPNYCGILVQKYWLILTWNIIFSLARDTSVRLSEGSEETKASSSPGWENLIKSALSVMLILVFNWLTSHASPLILIGAGKKVWVEISDSNLGQWCASQMLSW